MSVLADYLKELRKKENYTQQTVAKYLKINRSTYSNYENDYREPDFSIIEGLAELYNVPIENFWHNPLLYNVMTKEDETSKHPPSIKLSQLEKELLIKFRSLNKSGKNEIIGIIDIKLKTSNREKHNS